MFSSQKIENVSQFGITNLVKITRLKMTTVQTGYTRQEPLDSDLFLVPASLSRILISRQKSFFFLQFFRPIFVQKKFCS